MISAVRWRLLLMVAITAGGLIYGSTRLLESYSESTSIQSDLAKSHEIESMSWRWLENRPSRSEVDMARDLAATLEPAHRRDAFIKTIEASREGGLRARVDFLAQTEKDYRQFQGTRLPYWFDRVNFLSMGLLTLTVSSLLTLIFYLKRNIFAPLGDLSRKMTDFLNDRYTYQFTVPSPTELGHLQATFNSLAQRVLRNMEDLTTLDHAKSEFLSIASHELRTPLTSIKGSLSLLRSGVVGPQNEMAANLLNIAESETDRLIRLINELLDLAKIEAGKFEVRPEWHSLGDLVERTFAGLSGLAQASEVALEAIGLPPVIIKMDQDRIQQVLTNLISNAIKFSPKRSTVEISADTDEDHHVRITVTDHGRGIAPEDQLAIFQKFRQATSPKNPLVKGTGLGLAIAKALVEEHGGKIGVHSAPDEGSTFYFTLPEWQYAKEQSHENIEGVAA
jgi:signal transduction histidine kinase